MRVSLVPSLLYHPYSEKAYADFPLGVLTIATVFERRGATVSIPDLNLAILDGHLSYHDRFYEAAADWVLAGGPDVVGFSTLCTSFLQTLRIAEQVRRRAPDTLILLGGPNTTFLAKPVVKELPHIVDAVICGEGEIATNSLITALEAGIPLEGVPGVLTPRWPADRGCSPALIEDLDQAPPPAWHLYPVEHGLEKGYWSGIEIEAGRGCPFSCTFCTTSKFWGRRHRVKSAAFLVNEILGLSKRFGVTSFSMVHDLFTCRRSWVEEVCGRFIAAGSPVRFSISARADTLTPALLSQLAAAGCRDIYIGIESGSPRMQLVIRKRLDLESVRQVVAFTQQSGIRATASFMMGFPEEEREDLEPTLELFCLYKIQERAQLHLLALYPGIELVSDFRSLQLDEHLPDGALNLHTSEDLEWVRARPELFLNYYHLETKIDRELLKRIQTYYLSITSYVAHLLAKRYLGLSLFECAVSWLESTSVRFDAARINVETMQELAGDAARHLQARYAERGAQTLFDDICLFQRASRSVLERAQRGMPDPDAWAGGTLRLGLLSPIEVIDLTYDIPALVEGLTAKQAPELVSGHFKYVLYMQADRVRFRRLDRTSARFLALCLEGWSLPEVTAELAKDLPADAFDLAAPLVCARTAADFLRDGILQRL
jgi:radical SAM superfamily enzyme YgiQ (UPF0313 family)